MHGVFTRVLLHQLLEEAGGDRAEAARRAGVGRTTMYRWIKAGLLEQSLEAIQARDKPRPPESTKWEPYKAMIEARLREYPRLSAVRIFGECHAAGYTGGLTQLRVFVRSLLAACMAVESSHQNSPSHDRDGCRIILEGSRTSRANWPETLLWPPLVTDLARLWTG